MNVWACVYGSVCMCLGGIMHECAGMLFICIPIPTRGILGVKAVPGQCLGEGERAKEEREGGENQRQQGRKR